MTEPARIADLEDTATSANQAEEPTVLQTDRYLRLSIVFLVVTLFISVLVQSIVLSWDPFDAGWRWLPSISHYFYSPARIMFVSVLIAASLALLAVAGRRAPATFLDIAAIFAPLIAIVPTGLDKPAPNDESLKTLTCDESNCIPTDLLADVRVSVATYVLVVLVVVISMAVIRARKNVTTTPAHVLVSAVAVVTAVGVAALALFTKNFPFDFWPVNTVHFGVVLLFFGTFAAVPILYGWRDVEPGETPPTATQKFLYRLIAVLMVADLAYLGLVFWENGSDWGWSETFPWVLVGEALALGLFAWFWWLQSLQRWPDVFRPYKLPTRADR